MMLMMTYKRTRRGRKKKRRRKEKIIILFCDKSSHRSTKPKKIVTIHVFVNSLHKVHDVVQEGSPSPLGSHYFRRRSSYFLRVSHLKKMFKVPSPWRHKIQETTTDYYTFMGYNLLTSTGSGYSDVKERIRMGRFHHQTSRSLETGVVTK